MSRSNARGTVTATTDEKMETPEAQLRSFLDRLDPTQQKLVRSIRAAVRKRFPTANELAYDYSTFFVLAYSLTERGIEGVVSIAARAEGVDLVFNHGPQLPDPKKLLRGSGKQTRHIRLESARQLKDPDVEALLAAAIERASVPLPARGKGRLVIKTNRTIAAKKRPRRKPAK